MVCLAIQKELNSMCMQTQKLTAVNTSCFRRVKEGRTQNSNLSFITLNILSVCGWWNEDIPMWISKFEILSLVCNPIQLDQRERWIPNCFETHRFFLIPNKINDRLVRTLCYKIYRNKISSSVQSLKWLQIFYQFIRFFRWNCSITEIGTILHLVRRVTLSQSREILGTGKCLQAWWWAAKLRMLLKYFLKYAKLGHEVKFIVSYLNFFVLDSGGLVF